MTVKKTSRFHPGVLAKSVIVFVIPFLTLTSKAEAPVQETSSEYKIKAVFLYNFSQFVEWPEKTFAEQGTPLVIGILGKDPFGYYLDETVYGENANDHPMIVKRFVSVKDVSSCHILFIKVGGKEDLTEIFDRLKSKSILTVGDTDDFIRKGGMVRFFTEKNKTRIQINLEAVEEAGLIISSKLLGVAEIVSPQNK